MNISLEDICTVRALVKEHGKISPCFLMRKMKLCSEKANELYELYGWSPIKEKINNKFRDSW